MHLTINSDKIILTGLSHILELAAEPCLDIIETISRLKCTRLITIKSGLLADLLRLAERDVETGRVLSVLLNLMLNLRNDKILFEKSHTHQDIARRVDVLGQRHGFVYPDRMRANRLGALLRQRSLGQCLDSFDSVVLTEALLRQSSSGERCFLSDLRFVASLLSDAERELIDLEDAFRFRVSSVAKFWTRLLR